MPIALSSINYVACVNNICPSYPEDHAGTCFGVVFATFETTYASEEERSR